MPSGPSLRMVPDSMKSLNPRCLSCAELQHRVSAVVCSREVRTQLEEMLVGDTRISVCPSM